MMAGLRYAQYPPGAWAGTFSPHDRFVSGPYPDMPATWIDKEVFQANISGAAVQISIGNPATINYKNNFVPGQVVTFMTTGSLPIGLTASFPRRQNGNANAYYYVLASGLSASSFQVSATPGGMPIATSGTQSGTHYIGANTNLAIIGVADKMGLDWYAWNWRVHRH